MTPTGNWLRMTAFSLFGLACLVVSGCTPLVRQRTLPPSIRAVYVPMILNRSSEPGLEERMTASVQKEILADGRLNLVRRPEADALVEITIRDFDRVGLGFDGDDFANDQLYRVDAEIQIRENIPGKPLIGGRRRITVESSFRADTRSLSYNAEPDSLEFLYEGFGRQVVMELLTGDYAGVQLSEQGDEPEAPLPAVVVPGR